MMKYSFQTEKLSVGYNGQTMIGGIEVSLKRGQILTIIGPNGSGKSTFIKSITKQLKLIGGTVSIKGSSIEDISSRDMARKVAVLLTERPNPELMTCGDVVAVGRYPYTGMMGSLSDNDREKIRQALEQVNALDLKDRNFMEISDGQLQRIMLARAICQEPEVLVLDEPTSFLDIRYAIEILDILQRMAKDCGVIIIMSLHELNFAKRVSDLVMCVKSGCVFYLDRPEKIFTEEIISQLYDLPLGYYGEWLGDL